VVSVDPLCLCFMSFCLFIFSWPRHAVKCVPKLRMTIHRISLF
jgi:hypothetical protein